MAHSIAGKRTRQIALLRTQFALADGLAFADVLPAGRVETALQVAGAGWRDCVYTPVLTLWAFLGQVVSPDGSCRAAVARWPASRVCSACHNSASPKARRRAASLGEYRVAVRRYSTCGAWLSSRFFCCDQ